MEIQRSDVRNLLHSNKKTTECQIVNALLALANITRFSFKQTLEFRCLSTMCSRLHCKQGRILLVGRPGANIEDGSSLIIHWSSGSQKRSTNWANQHDIYFGVGPYWWGPGATAPLDPLNPALTDCKRDAIHQCISVQLANSRSTRSPRRCRRICLCTEYLHDR